MKTRLIIFSTEYKKQCYEFTIKRPNNKEVYYCNKCHAKGNFIGAFILKNDNGDEYLSVQGKQHVCELIDYVRSKKEEENLKIIRKPHYQIGHLKEKTPKKLITFYDDDQTLCYEYTRSSNNGIFYCKGCRNIHNVYVSAKIIKDEKNGDDCLELGTTQHVCKPRPFILEKLTPNFVNSDGFKTDEYRDARSGEIKKRLIVFDHKDKSLCHIYHNIFNRGKDYWICSECQKLKKTISVKFGKNEEGQDFVVELNPKPHICELQEYIPSEVKPFKPQDIEFCLILIYFASSCPSPVFSKNYAVNNFPNKC